MPIEHETHDETPPFPVQRGDWVESREDPPKIGKIVNAFWSTPDEDGKRYCLVGVALYSFNGERIGRVSDAMGGPRNYEPSLDYGDWFRIKKPSFPVTLQWLPEVDEAGQNRLVAGYVTAAVRLADRSVSPKKKASTRRKSLLTPVSDYDPEIEVRSRRMAAQELRDLNRDCRSSGLIQKAEKLEKEADLIASDYSLKS